MKQKNFTKIITAFLVVALFATFGFLTGFVFPDNTNKNLQEVQDLGENEQEVETWTCDVCGYMYDPAVGDIGHGILAGTEFEALPDSWLCPVCSATKIEFENEDSQDLKTPEEWLAHLEHVLAMRSKHLVVLQRVIDAKITKNFLLNSINSLGHAILSSSKSVQKAQDAIDDYKAYMESLNNPDMTTTDTTAQTITNSEDKEQNTITNNINGNDNNNKNKKEKENKGKAKGKNK